MDSNDRPRTHAAHPRFARTAVAGQATFTGGLSIIHVARQVLRARLPPLLTLADGDAPTYPCLVVFGEQRDGMTYFGGLPVPWGIRYHELMVGIPFVRWQRAPGAYLFVLGMICDFWPAVWNGNFYYGFSKRLAQIRWDGECFHTTNGGRPSDFRAVLRVRGRARPDALDVIGVAAALPVLGRRHDGAFVHSRFDWNFEDAAIDAASLRLDPGKQLRTVLGESDVVVHEDVYRVQGMRWRLSWPLAAPS